MIFLSKKNAFSATIVKPFYVEMTVRTAFYFLKVMFNLSSYFIIRKGMYSE